jgi:hypothetical protein
MGGGMEWMMEIINSGEYQKRIGSAILNRKHYSHGSSKDMVLKSPQHVNTLLVITFKLLGLHSIVNNCILNTCLT